NARPAPPLEPGAPTTSVGPSRATDRPNESPAAASVENFPSKPQAPPLPRSKTETLPQSIFVAPRALGSSSKWAPTAILFPDTATATPKWSATAGLLFVSFWARFQVVPLRLSTQAAPARSTPAVS